MVVQSSSSPERVGCLLMPYHVLLILKGTDFILKMPKRLSRRVPVVYL